MASATLARPRPTSFDFWPRPASRCGRCSCSVRTGFAICHRPSAFAGNPLLISPQPLIEQGFLQESELTELADLPTSTVDFGRLLPLKSQLLKTAFDRARQTVQPRMRRNCQANAAWLDDFALFSALKDESGLAWTDWEPGLRERDAAALARGLQHQADASSTLSLPPPQRRTKAPRALKPAPWRSASTSATSLSSSPTMVPTFNN